MDLVLGRALAKSADARYRSVADFLAAVREAGADLVVGPCRRASPDFGLWVSAELPGEAVATDEPVLLAVADSVLTQAESRCLAAGLEVLAISPCAILATGRAGLVDLESARVLAASIARDAALAPGAGRLVLRVGVSPRDPLDPDRWPASSFLPVSAD
jgi:hypothetical protein